MRGLTLWRCVGLSETLSWSENIRTFMIIGCVTLLLYWPLWWWYLSHKTIGMALTLKAIFYTNLMAMWVSWVAIYLVLGKDMNLQDDSTWIEILKSLCFLTPMLLIMDLPLMLSQL